MNKFLIDILASLLIFTAIHIEAVHIMRYGEIPKLSNLSTWIQITLIALAIFLIKYYGS